MGCVGRANKACVSVLPTDQKVRGSDTFGRTLLLLISLRAYRLNGSDLLG